MMIKQHILLITFFYFNYSWGSDIGSWGSDMGKFEKIDPQQVSPITKFYATQDCFIPVKNNQDETINQLFVKQFQIQKDLLAAIEKKQSQIKLEENKSQQDNPLDSKDSEKKNEQLVKTNENLIITRSYENKLINIITEINTAYITKNETILHLRKKLIENKDNLSLQSQNQQNIVITNIHDELLKFKKDYKVFRLSLENLIDSINKEKIIIHDELLAILDLSKTKIDEFYKILKIFFKINCFKDLEEYLQNKDSNTTIQYFQNFIKENYKNDFDDCDDEKDIYHSIKIDILINLLNKQSLLYNKLNTALISFNKTERNLLDTILMLWFIQYHENSITQPDVKKEFLLQFNETILQLKQYLNDFNLFYNNFFQRFYMNFGSMIDYNNYKFNSIQKNKLIPNLYVVPFYIFIGQLIKNLLFSMENYPLPLLEIEVNIDNIEKILNFLLFISFIIQGEPPESTNAINAFNEIKNSFFKLLNNIVNFFIENFFFKFTQSDVVEYEDEYLIFTIIFFKIINLFNYIDNSFMKKKTNFTKNFINIQKNFLNILTKPLEIHLEKNINIFNYFINKLKTKLVENCIIDDKNLTIYNDEWMLLFIHSTQYLIKKFYNNKPMFDLLHNEYLIFYKNISGQIFNIKNFFKEFDFIVKDDKLSVLKSAEEKHQYYRDFYTDYIEYNYFKDIIFYIAHNININFLRESLKEISDFYNEIIYSYLFLFKNTIAIDDEIYIVITENNLKQELEINPKQELEFTRIKQYFTCCHDIINTKLMMNDIKQLIIDYLDYLFDSKIEENLSLLIFFIYIITENNMGVFYDLIEIYNQKIKTIKINEKNYQFIYQLQKCLLDFQFKYFVNIGLYQKNLFIFLETISAIQSIENEQEKDVIFLNNKQKFKNYFQHINPDILKPKQLNIMKKIQNLDNLKKEENINQQIQKLTIIIEQDL